MMFATAAKRSSLERQLFSNQIWESVAFIAKAAFMLGLTPWMLRVWGGRGYGEFALASSAFVLLSILDFGIRGYTRVALCRAAASNSEKAAAVLRASVSTLALIALCAAVGAWMLTFFGTLDRVFRISPSNHYLLPVTTTMTMLITISGVLLEPLVAAGNIGRVKLATAAGWLLAIPAVAGVLWTRAGVTFAVFSWLVCLLGANTGALLSGTSIRHLFVRRSASPNVLSFVAVVRRGVWFNTTTATWLVRTYGATLLISACDGPATAGAFFILLRMSEIISALGAIACDVSLGELALSRTVEQRRTSFRTTYSWTALCCIYCAVVLGFAAPDLYQLWLGDVPGPSHLLGVVIAALGLGSALNRTATYAALGLQAGRTAAVCGAIEALAFILILAGSPHTVPLLYRVGWASASALVLAPVAVAVSRHLDLTFQQTWVTPLRSLLPGIVGCAAMLLLAHYSGRLVVKVAAVAICGVIFLLHFLLGRGRSSAQNNDCRPDMQTAAEMSVATCEIS